MSGQNMIEWKSIDFLDSIKEEASNNKLKIPKKDFLSNGKYPIIDQGANHIAGYTNDSNKVYKRGLPVVVFGDHTRALKYIDFEFALGADGVKILVPGENISAKYLFYVLKNLNLKTLGYSRHYKLLKEKKVTLPFVNGKPDIKEQERIASILEDAEKVREKGNKAEALLDEYLKSGSYKDISRNVSQRLNKGYTAKSVDNALLRIRKKAQELKRKTKVEKIPLFNV